MKRGARIDILLVADAKRRVDKKNDALQTKAVSEINAPKVQPVDAHSQALIYKRFNKDLK